MQMSQQDYIPDTDAIPSGSLATAILSQRDLSARIPINFVTHPGVSLTAACFNENRYEDQLLRKCLSNLLSIGFRRIFLDAYWDPLIGQWSLCPIAIPSQWANTASSSSEATRSVAQTTGLSISDLPTSVVIGRGVPTNVARAVQDLEPLKHQTSPVATTASSSDASSGFATATAPSSNASLPTEVAGSPGLFQFGDIQCTSTVNINLVRNIFEDHFVTTGNNINATLKYLILNLRQAELLEGQDVPIDTAPPQSSRISRIFNTTLAPFIYTPENLRDQRNNLNATWFAAPFEQRPDTLYYQHTFNEANIATTTDGWPSEGYAELIQAKRMLIGFGDSSISNDQYNTSLDDAIIFPSDTLTSPRELSFSSTGAITSGCLYNNTSPSPFQSNISFAIPSYSSLNTLANSPQQIINTSSLLPACGISPLVITTLSTPATSISPYESFIRTSLWSWQPNQPASTTNDTQLRCASLNLTSPANGKWQLTPCTTRLQGACRIASQPYEWTLSTQRGPYDSIPRVCPPNSTFSVPHTALENSHLLAAIRASRSPSSSSNSQSSLDTTLFSSSSSSSSSSDPDPIPLQPRQDPSDALIWLNLNDLNLQGCFVEGINATCPYAPRAGEASRRVIVPIVAAVIVFVLAGLTVLTKCAANRAGVKRRRRRRGGKGAWRDGLGEYEGVPS
ncbi:hypothetical protein BDZ85DRAFT_319134 [Elsinoe ampelina]|uniref:Maintenance of telomere capping protein 6 n=1 Tax=Elsinoe ampelina TaxID=302913 RepID=A0A6A6GAR6_9PEZI|nr:hypothetical protein BDZ85DRAFT_319134 [Elsinoe ampelina]